ncbi:hypothetical protein BC629DRAFT_883006 [Irpex lacteus]|nr:hypothetical protein BC629DRAFT_883006 [Irpex lacteus]
MSYEHPHTGTAKFESLHLSELWEAVAGRIDFHLSDPSSCSYNSASAATWRALIPATQRSYMVVAIKKFERQFYKDSPMRKLNSMEAYMGLLNAMHELLWMTPNVAASQPTKPTPKVTGRIPPRFALGRVTGNVEVATTATILPLSAAWNSFSRSSRVVIPPSHPNSASAILKGRRPVSPLARFVTVSFEQEDEDLAGDCASLKITFREDSSSEGSSDV